MPSMTSDGWKKQGQLVRQEPWLCGPGEFSEEGIHRCLWHFCGNREEPVYAKAVMGQQLPDVPGAE